MRQRICYSHQGKLPPPVVQLTITDTLSHVTDREKGHPAGLRLLWSPVHTQCNGPCLCKRVQGESLAKYHISYSLNDPRERVVTVMTTGRQSADGI
jgi:hypothetical protein